MINRLGYHLRQAFVDIPKSAQTENPFVNPRRTIVSVAILGIWLSIVIFTATRHELGRDEVRAFSLARAATSPLDLYGLTKYEGHPVLWYLILYVGRLIVHTPVVLPIISIVIAFAAVTTFVFLSPFPFWIRYLFIFSALPFYEYSVIPRNYGISMLLLFVGAVLYRKRAKHPLSLAFVLALLANTNVHSAIFAGLIAGLWAWDTAVERRTAPPQRKDLFLYLPFIIVFAGLLLCVVFAMPKENTIVTSIRHSVTSRDVARSLLDAVLRPGQTFSQIMPAMIPGLVASIVLFLAAFGLLCRPSLLLAALGGQIALGLLFRVVYPGAYRHQGLFLIFLVFLYWLLIESLNDRTMIRVKRLSFSIGLYVALVALIAGNVVRAESVIRTDFNREMSASPAFGEFLKKSVTYHDAVIVPEPDYLLESLPYYTRNRIYFAREHRVGTTVSFTTEARYRLSLGELLSVARDMKASGQPVLIVLGHSEVEKDNSGEKKYSYNRVFSWDTNESANFFESTALVRDFKSAYSDENYRVYSIK
jgi:hypothetical protein